MNLRQRARATRIIERSTPLRSVYAAQLRANDDPNRKTVQRFGGTLQINGGGRK